MRISYNKLQKLMIDNQMKRQDLMRAAEISSSVATKLNKNETVSLLRVNNQKTERGFFRAKKYIPAVNYCKTVYNS